MFPNGKYIPRRVAVLGTGTVPIVVPAGGTTGSIDLLSISGIVAANIASVLRVRCVGPSGSPWNMFGFYLFDGNNTTVTQTRPTKHEANAGFQGHDDDLVFGLNFPLYAGATLYWAVSCACQLYIEMEF